MEAEQGFLVENGPFYTGGESSPVGLDLPVSTLYCQNTSTGIVVWRKYGIGTNDWAKAAPNDFYQSVSAVAETSTTSTTVFATKLTLTTPALPSGDYELAFSHKWRNLAANRSQDTRIQRNAANLLTWVSFNSSTVEASLQSGFSTLTAISGVQTFTLQFKVVGSATTTFMSEARMRIMRVG